MKDLTLAHVKSHLQVCFLNIDLSLFLSLSLNLYLVWGGFGVCISNRTGTVADEESSECGSG